MVGLEGKMGMTNEIKHTPGPWEWEDCFLYGKEDGYTVEIMEAYFPDDNEHSIENERLIAAAPDLLEVLKMAQLWLDVDGRFDMRGINAAIAKAEGRA